MVSNSKRVKECATGISWTSIRNGKNFYYSKLYNGDIITRNMITELNDHIYLCHTRTPR